MSNKRKTDLPKIILMTQTRKKDYTSLDIWKCLFNYKTPKYTDIKFIINHQKLDCLENQVLKENENHTTIETPFMSLSKARNALMKLSISKFKNFDYFLFIDDDAYIYDLNLLIESLIYCKINNYNGLIIGSIYKPNLQFINKHMKCKSAFKKLNFHDHNLIMGSCICFGRELIRKNISFDSDFGLGSKYGGSEETDIFFNSLKNRINIYYNQCFIVIHPPTYKNQYDFKKMFSYGTGRGAVYRKYLSINKILFISYLIYGLLGNFCLVLVGILSFQKSFFLRNLGLFFGKLNGFLSYSKK